MKANIHEHTMRALCSALQVSRSGYYAWTKRAPKAQPMLEAVAALFTQHKARAGAPSLRFDVLERGFTVCERTVGRALRCLGLKAKTSRKFKCTTDSKHKLPVAPNTLDRCFSADKPNQVWVGDITYIRTAEGWLYLAVLIDLFSRQVVGWQMGERINQELVCDALEAALANRGHPKGVLLHSDQGSQYCSKAYRRLILTHQLTQSMSRRGNCWDNAVAESFFATLKKQAVFGYKFSTRSSARLQVFEYIECYYNRVRRHSSNNWLSPVQFERLQTLAIKESPCLI